MLGVETLATQTLATSARERPFAARFADISRQPVFDLIYLVEVGAYLPAAVTVAAAAPVPPPPPGPPPSQRFTMTGAGGGASSGFGATSRVAAPAKVTRTYAGSSGGFSTGLATTTIVRAAPPPLPTIAGLIAHYDADASANSITSSSGRVSNWTDSSGVVDTTADIGITLDFGALSPDTDLTFARASTKTVYRSGPSIFLTATGQQALTTNTAGTTNLGLVVEGAVQQLVQNSKLAGGGTNPTGWTAITSGTRTPVASVYGNSDGAVAYQMVGTTQRPYLRRSIQLLDSTTYTMSMVVESASGLSVQNLMQVPGGTGTGATGTLVFTSGMLPATLPALVSMTFTTGTGVGATVPSWGIGVSTTESGTLTISRPQLTTTAGPVSFIPSDNGVNLTMAADVGTVPITGTNFNQTGSTFELIGRTAAWQGSLEQHFVQVDKGAFADSYKLMRWTDGHLLFQVTVGNVQQASLDFGLIANSTDFTVRVACATNSIRGSLNGGAIVQDTVASLPTAMTTMRVGMEAAAGTEWYGTIKSIKTWKSARANSELQTGILTTSVAGPALSQTTASFQPRYLLAAQNGRNVVAFTSATNEYLSSAASSAFSNYWTGGAYIVEMSRYTSVGGSKQSFGLTSGWSVHLQTGVSSGANIVLEVAYTSTSGVWASADFALGPTLRMIEIEFDSSTPTVLPVMRVDGVALAVRVIQAAVGSYTETGTPVMQIPSSAFGADAQICDLLFYGVNPSGTDKATLRSYLDSKWDRTKLATATSAIIPRITDESGDTVTDEFGNAIA